jgi:hypothetical protein
MNDTRKRRISTTVLANAVELAGNSSVNNAVRKYNISSTTIRNEMRRLNLPIRGPGSFTSKEMDAVGKYLV